MLDTLTGFLYSLIGLMHTLADFLHTLTGWVDTPGLPEVPASYGFPFSSVIYCELAQDKPASGCRWSHYSGSTALYRADVHEVPDIRDLVTKHAT